jgi:hypothetical protein
MSEPNTVKELRVFGTPGCGRREGFTKSMFFGIIVLSRGRENQIRFRGESLDYKALVANPFSRQVQVPVTGAFDLRRR